MNVLSLFDGISCGQIALNRAGISYDNYYASEIDKNAIKVTQSNYPNTIQLGDVCSINAENISDVDLLIGGSPCQGFSYCGKQLNFEDPRSRLFFEYVRLLEDIKPKYFLLENVKMKKEYSDVISSYLGVDPIIINSSLVSAQNRLRYYWTNIPNVTQPKALGIVLKDITEYNISEGVLDIPTYTIDMLEGKEDNSKVFIPIEKHNSKSGLICLGGVIRNLDNLWKKEGNLLQSSFRQGSRVYSDKGKSSTLNANSGGLGGKTGLYMIDGKIRKLTRTECERLQTVPEGYTDPVCFTQAVKCLGNGWTVDVIAHIFRGF